MAAKNLAQRINAIMQAVSTAGIKKGGEHPTQHYKYVSAEDAFEPIQAAMIEHGVVCYPEIIGVELMQFKYWRDEKVGKNGIVPAAEVSDSDYMLSFRFTLVNADDPLDRQSCLWFQVADPINDKAMGGAGTYAMKYWLMKQFMVVTEDTPDADKTIGRRNEINLPVKKDWVDGTGGWFIAHKVECVKIKGDKLMWVFSAGNLKATTFSDENVGGFDLSTLQGGESKDISGLELRVEATVSGKYTNITRVFAYIDESQSSQQKPATAEPVKTGKTVLVVKPQGQGLIIADEPGRFRGKFTLSDKNGEVVEAIAMTRSAFDLASTTAEFWCYEVKTALATFWIIDL